MKQEEVSENIQKENRLEGGFSSNIHTTLIFTDEGVVAAKTDDVQISEKYGINTIVTLSVNPSKLFIYWEITDDILIKNDIQTPYLFFLTLYAKTKDSLQKTAIAKLETDLCVGQKYAEANFANKIIYCELSAKNSLGEIVTLLISNSINTPADFITNTPDQTWLTRKEQFSEIIKASVSNIDITLSSFSILKELNIVKVVEERLLAHSASSELLKKDQKC